MVMIDIEYQKRAEESNNMDLGNTGSKHSGTEAGQHRLKNYLKEDIQTMWHKVRLLQMSKMETLPKLKENSKLMKLKDEIMELLKNLKKNELDITV